MKYLEAIAACEKKPLIGGVGIPISQVIWEREQRNLEHGQTLCTQATHITVERRARDWKLTKMAACKLHSSFSKVCCDYLDGFSRGNQKECRK